jgi:hypothetical protein
VHIDILLQKRFTCQTAVLGFIGCTCKERSSEAFYRKAHPTVAWQKKRNAENLYANRDKKQ